jgi:hypothetical protein
MTTDGALLASTHADDDAVADDTDSVVVPLVVNIWAALVARVLV